MGFLKGGRLAVDVYKNDVTPDMAADFGQAKRLAVNVFVQVLTGTADMWGGAQFAL